ncbi:hypothetical protein BXZ70DRAFT_907396 [Cristinia sonorae]|uniref:Uncharacterized protein n=1 Tax=Cristinia sonorae TaxID=1940300 RepID=A0A8K0UNY8_9AGAR|nr:hypothetical protein BXZ70DRAFT_907396 [Cristinia sonorae]
MTSSNTTIAIVNEQSTEINYSGEWVNNGTHQAAIRSGAGLTFTYNGTKVWVTGTFYPLVSKRPWSVTFSLDGRDPLSLIGHDSYTVQSNVGLWESQDAVTLGEHTLVMRVTTASKDTPFLLDQILYAPEAETPRPGVTYNQTTPPQVTVTVSSVPGPSHSSVSTGAIVGIVVGGVVALLVAGLLAFWFYRKRMHPAKPFYYGDADAAEMLQEEGTTGVTLTDAKETPPSRPPNHSESNSHPPASESSCSHGSSRDSHDFTITPYQPSVTYSTSLDRSNSNRDSDSSPPATRFPPGLDPPLGKAAESALFTVTEDEPVYHQDSGVRLGGHGSREGIHIPAEVPPTYTPD